MRRLENPRSPAANQAQLMLLLIIITIKQTHHMIQALVLRLAASLGSVGSQAAGTVIPFSLRPPPPP